MNNFQKIGDRIGSYLWSITIDPYWPKNGPNKEYVPLETLSYIKLRRRMWAFRIEHFCWKWGCRLGYLWEYIFGPKRITWTLHWGIDETGKIHVW